jgi:predicted ATPase/class 3 adenylate cyclase
LKDGGLSVLPALNPAVENRRRQPRLHATVCTRRLLAMTLTTPAPDLRDRLLAILAADVAGYSRLVSLDARATVVRLDAARAVFREQVGGHGGRIVDTAGDSVLAVFDTVTGAVDAAMAVQRQIESTGAATPEHLRLRFRIGIHVGDIIEKGDGTVYGDGVNIAARLQALAEPGSLAVSQAVHGMVARRVSAVFDDIGEQPVKNIPQPVRAYRLRGASVRFGHFELRFAERTLLVDGHPTALPERALDLLIALSEQPGQLVGKQALVERVWPGVALEEADIVAQINALRQLLGAEIVATVPGRGYRFTPPVVGSGAGVPRPSTDDGADPSTLPRLRTNLPAELTPLLGRAEDLVKLGALIERYRLVTIVGAGGMGKTRLAQALLAARRDAFAHGVCWVEMASTSDGAMLPGRIAAALGLQLGGGDPRAGLLAAVAPLSLLVVLDNAEHVLAEVAELAGELHDSAPGLRLIVTSQAPLKLAAEHVYRIGPLAVPEGALPAAEALAFGAVALFTERAQAADAGFTLTDANAPAAIELCRSLDGLPLAIELAAARAPMLGVQWLASSMHDRLKLLTVSGNRAAPARQQTLRAALEWSHGFLNESERAVFRRLGVVAGSASLQLVQRVAADHGEGGLDEWAVLDALGVLVDRSLVAVLATDTAAADTSPRYRLLDSPRAYALERLATAGEQPMLRQRHALAMAALFDAAYDEYFSGRVGSDDWMVSLAADLDNAREALAWAAAAGDAGSALAIAATLERALPRALHAERMALADRTEALIGPAAPVRLQQRAWLACSMQWANLHKPRSCDAALRSLALARALHPNDKDPLPLYLALCRFAAAAAAVYDIDAANAALAEVRSLEDAAWPPQRLIWGVEAEAQVAKFQGNAVESRSHSQRRLAMDRARGTSGSKSLANLIDDELLAGDAAAAVRSGTALVAALEGTREETGLAYARINLTAALLALDERDPARLVAKAAWPQAASFGLHPYLADSLALLAALDSRPRTAARLVGYADASYGARQESRQPNEAAADERTRKLARSTLGDPEFDRLHAEGARLRDADIAELAFGSGDS